MTCPTCHNAHSGECSTAALKARIVVLSKDPETIPRHLLVALSQAQRAFERRDRSAFGTINESVQPVADAALGWIREVERKRDEARAQLAACAAAPNAYNPDPEINALVATEAAEGAAFDLAAGIKPGWHKGNAFADRQRLLDLVRQQRGPLHDADLISDAEYAALAGDHGAVARLEGYDAMRAQLATLTAKADPRIGDLTARVRGWAATNDDLRVLCDVAGRVALLEALVAERDELLAETEASLANERGEAVPGDAVTEGWGWYVAGQVSEWRRGNERVIPVRPGRWEVHTRGKERIARQTARDAMRAANAIERGEVVPVLPPEKS